MKSKSTQNNNFLIKSFPISYGMKVLSIGTDIKLFEDGSAVLSRQKDIASKMEELHIIVFSLQKNGYQSRSFGNLHIYPTNSLSKISYIFDALKIGRKIIKTYNCGVISTQDPFETGLVGYKLSKKFDLPLQLQIHTDFLSPYFKNSFLNNIRVLLAKFFIPKADGLRVVSSVISDSLKKTFPNLKTKIDILPIFVDIKNIMDFHDNESVMEIENFPFTVLMPTRFTKEKRIDLALSIFKKITAYFPEKKLELYLVGRGPEKENIENQIKTLKLEKCVRVAGWEESSVISNLYRLSYLFLLTSEYEGYGMTLIEAGAAGCPIVTTEVGIAKTELFKNGENSFVCPVGDVDCLAKSIIDLIENPEKRQLFKERMQDSIKRIAYSKEEYVSRYVNLLQNLTQ